MQCQPVQTTPGFGAKNTALITGIDSRMQESIEWRWESAVKCENGNMEGCMSGSVKKFKISF